MVSILNAIWHSPFGGILFLIVLLLALLHVDGQQHPEIKKIKVGLRNTLAGKVQNSGAAS